MEVQKNGKNVGLCLINCLFRGGQSRQSDNIHGIFEDYADCLFNYAELKEQYQKHFSCFSPGPICGPFLYGAMVVFRFSAQSLFCMNVKFSFQSFKWCIFVIQFDRLEWTCEKSSPPRLRIPRCLEKMFKHFVQWKYSGFFVWPHSRRYFFFLDAPALDSIPNTSSCTACNDNATSNYIKGRHDARWNWLSDWSKCKNLCKLIFIPQMSGNQ